MTPHRADARALLDTRGYSGNLIRGQNPATLFEKPVRERIVESYYWKESCFGVNEADIVDRVVETVTFVGGVVGSGAGGGKPSPFLCLAFKMLQLGVEEAIVRLMLEQEEFKFVYLITPNSVFNPSLTDRVSKKTDTSELL